MKSREEAAFRAAGYACGFYALSVKKPLPRDIVLPVVSIDEHGNCLCVAKGRWTALRPNEEDELVAIFAGLLADGVRTNGRWSNLRGIEDTGSHRTRIEELLRGKSLRGKSMARLDHQDEKPNTAWRAEG
jgi:hypothetical protein